MLSKTDFINKVVSVLKKNGIGKYSPKQKCTLHVSNDDGDRHDFKIETKGKLLYFDYDDIRYAMKAIGAILADHIRRGDTVLLPEIGKFELRTIKARQTYSIKEGKVTFVPESYTIHFSPFTSLQEAVKSYTGYKRQLEAADAEELLAVDEDEVDEYGD